MQIDSSIKGTALVYTGMWHPIGLYGSTQSLLEQVLGFVQFAPTTTTHV